MGTRRRFSLIVAVAAATLLAAAASPAIAGQDPYAIGDDFFEPDFPEAVTLGGACFRWDWGVVQHKHNVRQDRKLFRSGNITSNDDAFFGHICTGAGTFHYYCENHGSENGGMDGRLKVEPDLEDITDDQFLVQWSYKGVDVGDRYDVLYRVNDGPWKDWKKNTSKFEAVFGKNDNPVDVKVSRTYSFKARTQKGSDDARVSGFSPKVSIVPDA